MRSDPSRARERLLWTSVSGTLLGLLLLVLIVFSRSLDAPPMEGPEYAEATPAPEEAAPPERGASPGPRRSPPPR